MEHPGFFERAAPIPLATLAQKIGAEMGAGADAETLVHDVRALADAGAGHVSFLDNRKYLGQLATTRASACIVAPAFADRVPAGVAALLMPQPYRGFALALHYFYPDAMLSKAAMASGNEPPIHPTASLEEGVMVEPGAVIGREAQIGRGTVIAANALIGYRVTIGRGSYVGAGASVTHALVGDRVILHAGVRIGQDGFGFAMGVQGHLKVPQIGRVIIQDDVEIGANSCIDRGALRDTIVGEGTKIDNLVQIGHNVVIGRHCVIAGHVGIAGSAELEDFVVMGGQSGAVGHITIGRGAQVGGASHPKDDVAAGARVGGTPAIPLTEWARQLALLKRLTQREGRSGRS
ncbi:MAG TPA: UDP-3-O-(3-hydroxymyristoyl)glucosamine N-acyltransferase [Hyphomicrobiaceae bacterium]|nr:UDP-3-O-(3-hydroxymyristoyl)glucosamine N-acyltransferase [Hyphomicrobiaceae bacterium]